MRKRPFTLMEVMIAALVLSLSAVATLSIVGTSRAKVLKEKIRWEKEHFMTNAVEFFLSAGPDQDVPKCLLPEGWSATCTLDDVDEGLPDAALESIRGWRLGEFFIQLYDDKNNLVNEVSIRKILKDDDVGHVSTGAEGL